MTGFDRWWRENEAGLAREHYDGEKWSGIHQLLRRAYEGGITSLMGHIESELAEGECDEWQQECLVAKGVIQELTGDS